MSLFNNLFSSSKPVPQNHESQVNYRQNDFFYKAEQMKAGDSVMITDELCESLELSKKKIYTKLRFCSDAVNNNPDGSITVWRLMCDCIRQKDLE